MIRLIRFLITGYWHKHEHKFVIHEEIRVQSIIDKHATGKIYILKCECGEMKEKAVHV